MSVLHRLTFLVAAVAALFPVAAAAAGERPDSGVQVSYQRSTGRYCVRLTRTDPTMPTGLNLYRTNCQPQRQWMQQGVTIARRGTATEIAAAK